MKTIHDFLGVIKEKPIQDFNNFPCYNGYGDMYEQDVTSYTIPDREATTCYGARGVVELLDSTGEDCLHRLQNRGGHICQF